jgi:hypothetical protein
MRMSPRERLLIEQSDDPFGSPDYRREAEDTEFGPAIPEDIRKRYAGRWVLLRGREAPEVVAVGNDLDELAGLSERRADDVAVYVRDPQRTYG